MKKEDAVNIFSDKIKSYLKRSKITQSELAVMLDLTPSAVSQKFKCNILMSMTELKSICRAMRLASEETLELQALLAKIRANESDGTSPFNRFMKNCRREKNLSFLRLSQLSGISIVRLRSFEEDFNVVFSAEDAEKLSKIYEVSAEIMMQKMPFSVSENMTYTLENSGVLEVRDGNADVRSSCRRVPVVNADEFKSYSGSVDLFAFGTLRCSAEILYDIKRDVVGINVPSSLLDLSFECEACLLVTDKKPFVHVAGLFFAMDCDKEFHILERKTDDEKFYDTVKDGSRRLFDKELLWTVAIVEIKLCPELLV